MDSSKKPFEDEDYNSTSTVARNIIEPDASTLEAEPTFLEPLKSRLAERVDEHIAESSGNSSNEAEPFLPDKPGATTDMPPYLFMVTRKRWGAMPPKAVDPKPHVASTVLFTYRSEAGDGCYTLPKCSKAVRKLQRRHMRKGLPDLPYNFLVGGDGKIYVARGWRANPQILSAFQYLKGCLIEIACIGDYRDAAPHDIMFDAVYDLVHYGRQQGFIEKTYLFIDNYD